jgi:cytoskeletal protein RodZ
MARENEARINRLEAISDSPSRPLPWGVFAVVLLAIALALSLWSHRRREQERLTSHPPAPKATLESPAVPEPTTQDTSQSAMTNSESQPSAPVTTTDSTPTSAASSGLNPPTASSQSSLNPTEAAPAPGEFTVTIHARDECWISIAADHKPVPSEILPPGTDRTIHARKEVVIKAGNIGALDLRLNGKKLDVGGDFQQVKTVTIGPAGLLPTPSTSPQSP